MGPRDADGRV